MTLHHNQYIFDNYFLKPAYIIAKDIGWSTSKVQRFMISNNLNRLNYKRDFLINNYSNLGPKKIADYFNDKPENIRSWASRLELKYFVQCVKNEKFFDTWSSNMAYILGFVIADGYIRTKKSCWELIFGINTKDRAILQYIVNNISPNSKIIDKKVFDNRTNKFYKRSELCIYSKKIVNSLMMLGVIQCKTGHEKLPDIPEEFKFDFLCGYHDGDGYLRGNRYFEFTCANKSFLEDINNKICMSIGVIKSDRDWFKLTINGKDNVLKIDKLMTRNRDFFLNRKHL